MSEKRKSTPKAKVLTAVLLVLFLGSCAVLIFAVCTDILGVNNQDTTPTGPVITTEALVTEDFTESNTKATEVSSSIASSSASQTLSSEITLGSSYSVEYWVEYKDENGTPGLGVLFGARTQGAVVTFEEGRFTVSNLSYDEYVPVASGTYSFASDSEIELRFDNSDIETADILETENGVVTSIDFPMDIEDTTLRLSLAD